MSDEKIEMGDAECRNCYRNGDQDSTTLSCSTCEEFLSHYKWKTSQVNLTSTDLFLRYKDMNESYVEAFLVDTFEKASFFSYADYTCLMFESIGYAGADYSHKFNAVDCQDELDIICGTFLSFCNPFACVFFVAKRLTFY
jgi:hypothetical protein